VDSRARSAADDLGLTKESHQEFKRRLSLMFAQACIMFGAKAASKLFRDQARAKPRSMRGKRSPPPPKRKGPHDPESDLLLLQLWLTFNGKSKRAFAKMALTNHAVKIGTRVRVQEHILLDSLVRRLNRILKRRAEMRQLGRSLSRS
jgi:hypothetical protein